MNHISAHTDLQSSLSDLRGDDAALRLLAAKFIKRYPEKVHLLSSAFREKDLPRFAGYIHRLRGALGIFRAARAQAMAVVLEHKAQSGSSPSDAEFSCFMDELAGVASDLSLYLGSTSERSAPDQ